jgi:hypothetical protein
MFLVFELLSYLRSFLHLSIITIHTVSIFASNIILNLKTGKNATGFICAIVIKW